MNIDQLETKNNPDKVQETVEVRQPETVSSGVEDDAQLAQMFGVDQKMLGRYSSKINTIMDWAKANTPEGEDVRWTLRRLETKLGTPPFGVDKISHMAEYAYLWLQNQDINKKLDQYVYR